MRNMRNQYNQEKKEYHIDLFKSSRHPGKTGKNYVTTWIKLLLYTEIIYIEKMSRNVNKIIAYRNCMYRKLCSQILFFSYTTSLKHRKQNIIAALRSSCFRDIRKTTVSFFRAHLFAKNHPSIFPEYRGMSPDIRMSF